MTIKNGNLSLRAGSNYPMETMKSVDYVRFENLSNFELTGMKLNIGGATETIIEAENITMSVNGDNVISANNLTIKAPSGKTATMAINSDTRAIGANSVTFENVMGTIIGSDVFTKDLPIKATHKDGCFVWWGTNAEDATKLTLQNDGTVQGYIHNRGKGYFAITEDAKELSTLTTNISKSDEYIYNGEEHTVTVEIKDGSKKLAEGTDYTVTYTNNKNAGQATVTVEGKGGYTGTITDNFTISPKALTEDDVDYTFAVQKVDGYVVVEGLIETVLNGKEVTLVKGTDYTIGTLDAEEGVFYRNVKVTFKNNFTGEFETSGIKMSIPIRANMFYEISDKTYTGSPITPDLTVAPYGTEAGLGDDYYTVSYGENTAVGKGTIEVTGLEPFTGTVTIEFNIIPIELTAEDFTVSGIESSYPYAGAVIEHPELKVTLTDGKELVEGTDYNVTYPVGYSVGEHTVKISFTGIYSGPDYTTTYAITAIDMLKDDGSLVDDATCDFGLVDGNPQGTITYNDLTLELSTDYTAEIVDDNLVITFIGNFAGDLEETANKYSIPISTLPVKTTLTKSMFNVDSEGKVYDGTQIMPEVTVTTIGEEAGLTTTSSIGVDYEVIYGENKNAGTGTGTVVIKGKGSFVGELRYEFNIQQKTVTEAIVEFEKNEYVYSGTEIMPAAKVTVDGVTLVSGEDYTVTYTSNVNVGEATATVRFKGNYSGADIAKTFDIKPVVIVDDNGNFIADVTKHEFVFLDGTFYSEIEYKGVELVEDTDYVVDANFESKSAIITFSDNFNRCTYAAVNVPVKVSVNKNWFEIEGGTSFDYDGRSKSVNVVLKEGNPLGEAGAAIPENFKIIYRLGGVKVDAPVNQGNYTVHVEAGGEYYGETDSLGRLSINRASAGVAVKDVTANVGSDLPSFELELFLIVPGDVVDFSVNSELEFTITNEDDSLIKDENELGLTDLDAIWEVIKSKPGTYKIVWKNYEDVSITLSGEDADNYVREGSRTAAVLTIRQASSGSGSSSNKGNTNITVPVSNDKNKVDVNANISGNDATIKPLDNQQINQIVGKEEAAGDVVVDLTEVGKNIDTAGIPKETLEAIVDAAENAGNDTEHLVIKLSTAELKLDDTAMRAIVEQADGDIIKFNFDDVGLSRMNQKQKDAVKNLDVRKGFEAYITVNGNRVSDFKGGNVEIIVPYEAPAGEAISGFSVWYIDEQGNPEKLKSNYDGKNKYFVVTHFSDYVIAYSDEDALAGSYHACPKDATCPIHPFTDAVTTAWYHDGVHYCIDNAIMKGYGDGTFGPAKQTTRAHVVQMLYSLEGKPSFAHVDKFADVMEGAWYHDAVVWASENGIVEGIDATTFAPDKAITREQMAAILYRYAQYKGYDVSVGSETNILSYEDAMAVSEYAIPAMQWACGSGLVAGIEKNGTVYLAPKGDAVRSQTATMFFNLCEKIVK